MARLNSGLSDSAVKRPSSIRRSSVRPNVISTPKEVGEVLEKGASSEPAERSRTESDFTKTPVFTKTTPFSRKDTPSKPKTRGSTRVKINSLGEEQQSYDIVLAGKDRKLFEELRDRLSNLMPGKKRVKNNDVVRAFLPTFLKIVKYVERERMPERPAYGSREYRQFTDELGELIWEATLAGISTELQYGGIATEDLTAPEHSTDSAMEEVDPPNIPRGPAYRSPLKAGNE